jgi:magnesium transporter
MNFDNMPELHTRHGYFVTVGLMAVVALALLGYFWKLGWIFQPSDPVIVKPDSISDEDLQDGRS